MDNIENLTCYKKFTKCNPCGEVLLEPIFIAMGVIEPRIGVDFCPNCGGKNLQEVIGKFQRTIISQGFLGFGVKKSPIKFIQRSENE